MSKQKTKIPEGWKEINLGKIIKFQGGFAFKTADYKESGIPLVRIGNIGKGSFINDNFVYITEKMFDECRSFQLHNNDILMGMTGDLGKVCKIKNVNLPALLNQRVGRIIIKNTNEVNSSYIYQLFLSNDLQKKFEKYFEGMAQKNISSGQIESTEILLPPLPVQNKIAEILETVDEEIEKVERIIEKSEKVKNGYLDEIFKYKKNNWRSEKLSQVANIERGRFSIRPRNDPRFYGGNIPFIQTGDVVGCNGIINRYHQTLNQDGLKVSKMFKKGTIVLTIAANIGDTGILEFDACFPDSLVGITVKEKMNNVFLEYYLRNKKDYLNKIATQSAQKNINLQKLEPVQVLVPPMEEQIKISNFLSSIDGKILIYNKIKNNLIQLKKGLMAGLLNGKVNI